MTDCYRFAGITAEITTEHDLFHEMSRDYRVEGPALLSVRTDAVDIAYERDLSPENANAAYLEMLAVQRKLSEAFPAYGAFLFHASALSMDGEGYLFAALSGTGKSTHAALWRQVFGDRVTMLNDDKPFLRIGDDVTVYGSPWDGKHRLSTNASAKVKAICLLERSLENAIVPISFAEAFPLLYRQAYRPKDRQALSDTLDLLNLLGEKVRFYRLSCNMDPEAARIAYGGMCRE